MKATELRQNLYKILDELLETGQTLTIERKGKILRIVPDVPTKKLDRLKEHKTIVGNPNDLLNLDWSDLWNPDSPNPKGKRK